MLSSEETRRCKDCGKVFPLTRDFFGSTRSGGHRYQCRSCMRQHVRAYDSQSQERKDAAVARAQKRADIRFTSSEREHYRILLERRDGGFACFYCKKALGTDFHIDHKVPIVKGGLHLIENFALACLQCNQEKHNKDVDEYRKWRRKNRLPTAF